MRKYSALAVALFILTAAPLAAKNVMTSAANSPKIVTAGHEHWVAGTGDMAGTQMATLSGDPSKAGSLYVIRLNLPANTKFPAHLHSGAEYVTVVSGTFYVGLGNKFDASKLTALPAGSFGYVPAKLPHYAMTKGPVILQIEGIGPFTMTAVEKGGKM
jgi:uncharacterized RmlC-like cupin family protein